MNSVVLFFQRLAASDMAPASGIVGVRVGLAQEAGETLVLAGEALGVDQQAEAFIKGEGDFEEAIRDVKKIEKALKTTKPGKPRTKGPMRS
jgi:hypothetical protein